MEKNWMDGDLVYPSNLDRKDGIRKIDLVDVKTRYRNMRKQLDNAWELLIRRGWWSYLTPFPLLDHDVIIVFLTEKEVRGKVSVHYLFDEDKGMWEVILAMVDEVHMTFPYPPGKVPPEVFKINGDSYDGPEPN